MDPQVAEMLRGYARANEFQERERMERLAKLSTEESWAIFLELVEQGQTTAIDADLPERMIAWRLDAKIAVRRTFRRLAEKQGLITNGE